MLHKEHDSAPVDQIPLGETIPAINMLYVMFFIVFNHANACASMCLLVEKHNNEYQNLHYSYIAGPHQV